MGCEIKGLEKAAVSSDAAAADHASKEAAVWVNAPSSRGEPIFDGEVPCSSCFTEPDACHPWLLHMPASGDAVAAAGASECCKAQREMTLTGGMPRLQYRLLFQGLLHDPTECCSG